MKRLKWFLLMAKSAIEALKRKTLELLRKHLRLSTLSKMFGKSIKMLIVYLMLAAFKKMIDFEVVETVIDIFDLFND